MGRVKFKSFYGNFMIIIGIITFVPLLTIPFYKEYEYILSFLIPSIASILLGLILNLFNKKPENVSKYRLGFSQESSIKVVFAWMYGFLIGALPFIIFGMLNPVQAIFESVSGFTTTGLSVIDVTKASKIILFHRSFMQYCGGLGFILVISLITTGKKSMGLYEAEGHTDRLLPNLKKTARIIFVMYSLFLVIGTILYIIFGMNFFDSICHTMCALSTGGFSTKLNSIGDYSGIGIRLVTVFLMIIGTTNFAVLLLIVRGKFKNAFKVSEMKFFAFLLVISIPIVAISLNIQSNMSISKAFSESLFNITSALSTTGYSTMSYTEWSPFSVGILIVIMIIGGGIGSTAGGLKMARVCLLCKITGYNIRNQISSQSKIETISYTTPFGRTRVNDTLILNTVGFFLVYMFIFAIGSLLISWSANTNLTNAMFEFSSSIGTVGLSIGITNPSTDMITLIIEIFGMMLGRLEIFTFIIAFSKIFRK